VEGKGKVIRSKDEDQTQKNQDTGELKKEK
jgi:hypothetical protein